MNPSQIPTMIDNLWQMSAAAHHPISMNNESSVNGSISSGLISSVIIQATDTRHQPTAVLYPMANSSDHTPAINKPQNKPQKHHQASQKPITPSPHPNQHTPPFPNSQSPTTTRPHHSSQQMKRRKRKKKEKELPGMSLPKQSERRL